MRILYAEKSYRPAPTELTYLPRSPLREYDYYAILEVGDIIIPILIEDLSTPKELGGKSATDMLLGVSYPVIFIMNRSIGEEYLQLLGELGIGLLKELCDSYSLPSLVSWSFPVIFTNRLYDKLTEEIKIFSGKTLYLQILAYDFWKELGEASLTYAPSIYYKYLLFPLYHITSEVINNNTQTYMNILDKLFWHNLRLRLTAEKLIYARDLNEVHIGFSPKLESIEKISAGSLQSILEEEGVNQDKKLVFIILLPELSNIVRNAEILSIDLHPSLASFITPILKVIHSVKDKIKHVEYVLIYDIDKTIADKIHTYISKLIDYINKIMSIIIPSTDVDLKVEEEYIDSNRDIAYFRRGIVHVFESRVKLGILIDSRKYMKEWEKLKDKLDSILNDEKSSPITFLVVRDTEKNFLKKMFNHLYNTMNHLYYIYADENIVLLSEKFRECIQNHVNQNYTCLSSLPIDIPVYAIPVIFYDVLGEGECKKIRGKLGKYSICCEFDRNVINQIIDCIDKYGYIYAVEVK